MERKRLAILLIIILYFVVCMTMGYVIYVIINDYGEALGVVCVFTFLFGMVTMAAIYELHSVFKLWKTLY